MPLSDAQRAQIIARQDLWRETEKAYTDVAGKYVKAWWMGDLPRLEEMPEPLTRDAMNEILEKRRDAYAALDSLSSYLAAL